MTNEQYERWKDFATRMAANCFNRNRRPGRDWIIEKVSEWFWWLDQELDWREYNSWDQDSFPICDHVSCFFENEYPCSRSWEAEELACRQFEDQWLGPVRCCIRAGIDIACEPSAGVIGFSVGDLRKMYPEGIPDWINSGFTDRDGGKVDLNLVDSNTGAWL